MCNFKVLETIWPDIFILSMGKPRSGMLNGKFMITEKKGVDSRFLEDIKLP